MTTPELAERAAAWSTTDRYATGLLPLAMPLRTVPPGYIDFITEVRVHGDFFRGEPVAGNDRAIAGPVEMSHQTTLEEATERAAELGIGRSDRVLVDTGAYRDPADWLLAPLAMGASIVLCANLDRTRLQSRSDAEKVTVVLA